MQTAFTTEQKQEDWFQEFIDEWKDEGKAEGKAEGLQQVVFRQITKRFGEIPSATKTQINELSLVELEKLSEDLLDFEQLADFDEWLLKKLN